ncbi:hypothetical protein GCM10010168_89410 [Actinoplanes ianthinogenes]|uniref:Uncharacterized protein n=1 Tax=Actinoplanes ianthinogenes TaxID=122358 RepID=A0ABM7LPV1_9ACTN|nr:hypothetical protein [Actinoplanes ianthinogenes]BCJ41299.1 hypothetical protein Aiant_19560 [Actinoplanes ianthinogenes]GGR56554.1 hypothetical protein GCM10010168_89410 [Actinoplanes ianthinogenes]
MNRFRYAFAALTAAALTVTTMVVSPAVAQAAAPEYSHCQQNLVIVSSSDEVVSAELGYTGSNANMLRARAGDRFGPWEQFVICWKEFNFPYHLNSAEVIIGSLAAGKWVSAEYGYTGSRYAMLRARADQIGPWETFKMRSLGNGDVVIASSQGYVSVERDYTGSTNRMLRARGQQIGPWETFRIVDTETGQSLHYLFPNW